VILVQMRETGLTHHSFTAIRVDSPTVAQVALRSVSLAPFKNLQLHRPPGRCIPNRFTRAASLSLSNHCARIFVGGQISAGL